MARKKRKTRHCVVNFRTNRVRSIHPSMGAAVAAEEKLPMGSHFVAECGAGWKKGTKVPW